MQDVMKLVRVASIRHLRNWEAPDALAQEIIPERVERAVAKFRRGHSEDAGKRKQQKLEILMPDLELTQSKATN